MIQIAAYMARSLIEWQSGGLRHETTAMEACWSTDSDDSHIDLLFAQHKKIRDDKNFPTRHINGNTNTNRFRESLCNLTPALRHTMWHRTATHTHNQMVQSKLRQVQKMKSKHKSDESHKRLTQTAKSRVNRCGEKGV